MGAQPKPRSGVASLARPRGSAFARRCHADVPFAACSVQVVCLVVFRRLFNFNFNLTSFYSTSFFSCNHD